MKNVIIFYELIAREYFTCNSIKIEIQKQKQINVYLFSVLFEWHKAVHLSSTCKIDFLMMPWMYNDSNYELVQPFIRNNPAIIIGNFHHEEISSPIYEQVLLPTTNNTKNSILHFVWTEKFASVLEKSGVQSKNIYITGNPRCDENHTFIFNRDSLSSMFGLAPEKKWILFAETRDDSFLLQQKNRRDILDKGIDSALFDQCALLDRNSLYSTIREMSELPNSFFNQFELIYRPHPGHRANSKIDNRVHVISELSIYEWLHVIDAYMTWQSTSIFESDMMGVASFLYEPIERERKFRVRGLEEYPSIQSIEDIMRINLQEIRDMQKKAKIYKKYLGKCDGKSIQNIAGIIIGLLESSSAEYRANYIGIRKCRICKKVMHEIVTEFMVKSNLLLKLRFPRISYLHIRDIPYKEGNLP